MGFLGSLRRPNVSRTKSKSTGQAVVVKQDGPASWNPSEGHLLDTGETVPELCHAAERSGKVTFPGAASDKETVLADDLKILPQTETLPPATIRKRRSSLKEMFTRSAPLSPEQYPPVPNLPDLVYSPSASSTASGHSPCISSASSIENRHVGGRSSVIRVAVAKNSLLGRKYQTGGDGATSKSPLAALSGDGGSGPVALDDSQQRYSETARPANTTRDTRTSRLNLNRLSLGLNALDLNINVDSLGKEMSSSASAMHGSVSVPARLDQSLASPLLKGESGYAQYAQARAKAESDSEDGYGSDSDDNRALAHSTPATSLDDTEHQVSHGSRVSKGALSSPASPNATLQPPNLNLRINAQESRRSSAYFSAKTSPISPAMSSPSSSFGCAGPGSSTGGVSPRNLSFGAKLCLEITIQNLKAESPNAPSTQPERLNTVMGRAYPSSTLRLAASDRSGEAAAGRNGTLKVALQRTRLVRRLENRRLTLMEEVELDGFQKVLSHPDGQSKLPSSPTSPSALNSMTGVLPSLRVLASITSNALSSALGDDKSVVQPVTAMPKNVATQPVAFRQLQEMVWRRWAQRQTYTERMVVIMQGGSVQLIPAKKQGNVQISKRARCLAGVVEQRRGVHTGTPTLGRAQTAAEQAEVAMPKEPQASLASISASTPISRQASNTQHQPKSSHSNASNVLDGSSPLAVPSSTSSNPMPAKLEKRTSLLLRAFQRPVQPPRSSTMPTLSSASSLETDFRSRIAIPSTERPVSENRSTRPVSQDGSTAKSRPDGSRCQTNPPSASVGAGPDARRYSMFSTATPARPMRESMPARPASQYLLPTSSSQPNLAVPMRDRSRGSSTSASDVSRSSIMEATEGDSDDEEMPLAFLKRDRALNASEDNIQHNAANSQLKPSIPRSRSTGRRSVLLSPDGNRPVSMALSDYAADELQKLQAEVQDLRAQQALSEKLRSEIQRMKALEVERQTAERIKAQIREEEIKKQQEEAAIQKKRDERKRWEDHRRRSGRLETATAKPAQPMAGAFDARQIYQPQPIYPQQPFVHPGFYNTYQSPSGGGMHPIGMPYGSQAGLPVFAPPTPYAMIPTPPATPPTPPRYPSPRRESPNHISSASGYNSDSSSRSRRISTYNATPPLTLQQLQDSYYSKQPKFSPSGLIQQATSPNEVLEGKKALSRSQPASASSSAQRRSASYGMAEDSDRGRQPSSGDWGTAPALPRSMSSDPRTANRGSRAFLDTPGPPNMPSMPRSRTSYFHG